MTTGKAYGILQRLPHFCDPAEAGPMLLQFVDVFGRRLEQAEADLLHVLRAHHVETADNEGSAGFTAPSGLRGDLDKIFALYLEALGGTSQLIKLNPRFTERTVDTTRFVRLLVDAAEQDSRLRSLVAYLRQAWDADTWTLLEQYRVENAYIAPDEIQPGLARALLTGDSDITAYIRARLTPDVRGMLSDDGGEGALPEPLRQALAQALNETILRDPSLFRRHQAAFRALTLPTSAWALINSLYADVLARAYRSENHDPERLRLLLDMLDRAEPAPSPFGDDLPRLNRMLLQAAYPYDAAQRPWGLRARSIPALVQVRAALVVAFNGLLQVSNLARPERFPGMEDTIAELREQVGGDVAWLNRRLLEAAFPLEIERYYVPYRERLCSLIDVLRRGASTRQGIVDIVAANLGIVGNDPAARAAKSRIEIEEFQPEPMTFYDGQVTFYQTFAVHNRNPQEEAPEVRVTLLSDTFGGRELCNVRIEDTTSGRSVQFSGRIGRNDRLVFQGATVLRNGVRPEVNVIGAVPPLEPGTSTWRFTADIVRDVDAVQPGGRFDYPAFGTTVFIDDAPVVRIEVDGYRYTPGVFTVTIPWHLPGFTDAFDETEDHPRHQILSLVNRVKAAGVEALVAYKQVFEETHDQTVQFAAKLDGAALQQTHETRDALEFDSGERRREQHDVADRLILTGYFDYTRFDHLNTFG